MLGLGIIGQFSLRCLIAAGMSPVVGIDAVKMRRDAALAAGADHVIDPSAGDVKEQLAAFLGTRGAEIVADATGVPDAIPTAMSLACDARAGGGGRQPARQGEGGELLRRPAPPLHRGDRARTATCSSSRPTRGSPARGTSTRRSTGCCGNWRPGG